MKVFLKRDVAGVGKANEVKDVSNGYARNYLFPRGLAVPATKGRVQAAEDYEETRAQREQRERERSQKVVEQMQELQLNFRVKAGETGRLYGSITSADVAEKLSKLLDMEFDKRWLSMDRPIRDIGNHMIDVKLQGGVRGHAQVNVEPES
ncbi:MAG: 50S ribosomal protein L9 [Anaerolineae bacterium]|nr:50S ribosomal protein L9 [Anaerolineae bacterium]